MSAEPGRIVKRSTPTVVVHLRQPYDIRIDRKGPWGNPFRIGVDGTREDCLVKFESMWRERLRRDAHGAWWDVLSELRGLRLGCHCKPHYACHGDILKKLIEELELIYE